MLHGERPETKTHLFIATCNSLPPTSKFHRKHPPQLSTWDSDGTMATPIVSNVKYPFFNFGLKLI